ncbi:Uncharacterized protein OBRU01_02299 [Operophtera brumata]|uniref:Uncharacterized protein n=1 Tax=Operophtera brumata TaxID=104452 RepID=A0A0L7LTB1_OPEBR|nr:Uncharacterized protein OBRU01_02299 [Operophtera brumata]
MSSENSNVEEAERTEVLYVAECEESSEDPPMEEWSSLIFHAPETNEKRLLYEKGKYHPGSGELCSKVAAMSDSAVLKHPFYNYPAVADPGIKEALLKPIKPIIYPDDGQELYLVICQEMGQCPVKMFHRGLFEEKIDLAHYCVDPRGVRAMAIALKYNRMVQVLSLMNNFLNDDACYHLGDMLTINCSLRELNLAGCRIGPEGAKRLFRDLPMNKGLKVINLNRNQLGDDGVEYIAQAVFRGLEVQQTYLSFNNIGANGANALCEAFQTHNKLIVLDLSWNQLYAPGGTYNLLSELGQNQVLQEVDLSWNSLTGERIGTAIKNLMKAPNLKYLNLSNNKLFGAAIVKIGSILTRAKQLITLDLSFNPLSPKDAHRILEKMEVATVKLQNVFMENVFVDGNFLLLLQKVKALKFRKNFVLTYGGVISNFVPIGPDIRDVLLNRADNLAKKPKKCKVDIALVTLQMLKDNNIMMDANEFSRALKNTGAPFDDDLINQIINVFIGVVTPKSKTINLKLLADYMMRKWPERKLPPTPPPEPVPAVEPPTVVEPPKGNNDKKGKKK